MSRLFSKLFSLFAVFAFFGILLGIPYYLFSNFFHTTSNLVNSTKEQLKKPEAENVTINSQYGTFNGKMDNKGLALAIIQVDQAASFKIKNQFNVNIPIEPYEKGTNLVLIAVLCKNNSSLVDKEDNHMIPSVNEFTLIGKNKYRIDIMAMTKLQSCGHGEVTPLVLQLNESKLLLLAFDVPSEEYIYNMTLQFGNPYTFNANINLPLKGV